MEQLAKEIIAQGKKIGFHLVAIVGAGKISWPEQKIQELKAQNYLSPFLGTNPLERLEPQSLLPKAKSIVMAGLAYRGEAGENPGKLTGRLASIAWGEDYHRRLEAMLHRLAARIKEIVGLDFNYLAFVDNKPILEKALAVKAGFGFFGKNSLLINPQLGSYLHLGGLLLELDLPEIPADHQCLPTPDQLAGQCGSCSRCLNACPTGAIVAAGAIDSRKCLAQISQTKGIVPWEYREKMHNYLYGCDLCQLVCPYNQRRQVDPQLAGSQSQVQEGAVDLIELLNMTKRQFAASLGQTAAGWRGRTTLQRNALIALGNLGDKEAIPVLRRALEDERPLIRIHAAWALKKIGGRQCREILTQALAKEKTPQVIEELKKLLEAGDP